MKRTEKRAHTREAILDAAGCEFEANGYAATVLSDISDSIGVTKGTVYFHFPTKAALAVAVIERYFVAWVNDLEVARAHPSAYKGLVELSERVAERYRDDVGVRAAVRLTREANLIDLPIPTPFVDWIAVVIELLSKGRELGEVRSDLHIDSMAWQLVACFFGSQQMASDLGRRSDLVLLVQNMWRDFSPALRPDRS
jgi:AcrR family transcriptional regulator